MDKGKEGERVDPVIVTIGEWGKWQTLQLFSIGVFIIPCCFPVLSQIFMNAEPDYWCAIPQGLAARGVSIDQWRNLSGQHKAQSACNIYDIDYDQLEQVPRTIAEDTPMRPCESFEYDRSLYKETFVTEYDLVCSRMHLKSAAQTLFFTGMVGGATGAGLLSDKFGRKTVIIWMMLMMSVVAATASMVTNFWVFLTARFFHALLFMGIMECIYTWNVEIVGGKYVTFVGIGVGYFWTAGWLILAAMAAMLSHWRHLLFAISLPGLLIVILIWTFPESPKWLYSVGRTAEAERIVRAVRKFNGEELPPDWAGLKAIEDESRQGKSEQHDNSATVLDLFRTPNMLKKTLILYVCWFVCSFTYYGLTLNATVLVPGSIIVNFTVSGLLEIPAYTLTIIFLHYYGRRMPFAVSLLLTGVCLFSTMALDKDSLVSTGVVLLGKTCSTFAFSTVFLYSMELYPTVVRTTGLGTSSTLARFGGMACGWVALLAPIHRFLPFLVFGGSAFVSGVMALKLPETHMSRSEQSKLPDTIAEGEEVPLQKLCSC